MVDYGLSYNLHFLNASLISLSNFKAPFIKFQALEHGKRIQNLRLSIPLPVQTTPLPVQVQTIQLLAQQAHKPLLIVISVV